MTNVLCTLDDSNGSMFVVIDEFGPSSKRVCVCVGSAPVCRGSSDIPGKGVDFRAMHLPFVIY